MIRWSYCMNDSNLLIVHCLAMCSVYAVHFIIPSQHFLQYLQCSPLNLATYTISAMQIPCNTCLPTGMQYFISLAIPCIPHHLVQYLAYFAILHTPIVTILFPHHCILLIVYSFFLITWRGNTSFHFTSYLFLTGSHMFSLQALSP